MKSFIEFFGCGHVKKNRDAFEYRVTKLQDIVKIIIPFFHKFPLEGVKSKDFADFCKVADLISQKKHLTKEGLETIKKIKAGMNRGRKLD